MQREIISLQLRRRHENHVTASETPVHRVKKSSCYYSCKQVRRVCPRQLLCSLQQSMQRNAHGLTRNIKNTTDLPVFSLGNVTSKTLSPPFSHCLLQFLYAGHINNKYVYISIKNLFESHACLSFLPAILFRPWHKGVSMPRIY